MPSLRMGSMGLEFITEIGGLFSVLQGLMKIIQDSLQPALGQICMELGGYKEIL